ncbi:MAG: hypothetical protein IKP69_06500, partial [Oscillospiraceae bacterium]|nr:hypothetical protein [Oscillospiraceae bacterium]
MQFIFRNTLANVANVSTFTIMGDNAFLNAESNAVDDLHNFCTWQGIPDDSNAYEALLNIIYEYQKI